jgi:hypothetical protein
VLKGARPLLHEVSVIELELSLTHNFLEAPLLDEVFAFLTASGFSVVALEQNHRDDETTGQALMVDGIFRSGAREGTER